MKNQKIINSNKYLKKNEKSQKILRAVQQFRKFKTFFFLKRIIANIFLITNFTLEWVQFLDLLGPFIIKSSS